MQKLAARHDALMRKVIEAHRGRVVKSTGDGFHAVFETAIDGLSAALAGQQAMIAEPWPAEAGPLQVRMGLYTGESRERPSENECLKRRSARNREIGAGAGAASHGHGEGRAG